MAMLPGTVLSMSVLYLILRVPYVRGLRECGPLGYRIRCKVEACSRGVEADLHLTL